MNILELFCRVDDLWQGFEPQWRQEQLASGQRQCQCQGQLCPSEVMTIVIRFHQSRYRDFKSDYTRYMQEHLRSEFPKLVSYGRFVHLMSEVLVPLRAYLMSCYGKCMGISFIDSTPIAVCHNRRISQHKVFDGLAARGKNSLDWFFGFKRHLVSNERGEMLACRLTPG
jgi:hypothetical protein